MDNNLLSITLGAQADREFGPDAGFSKNDKKFAP
jgi:hypothetical protein